MKKKIDANRLNLKDEVVSINRVTKVVKGGKNMSFAALVVIGDPGEGVVGYGSGKAKEVPQAIRKGIESAKKNLHKVNLTADHHSAPGARPLRRRSGAAEACPRRYRSHRRQDGSRRHDRRRRAERADQVARHREPAQRHQGHLRRSHPASQQGRSRRPARQDSRRALSSPRHQKFLRSSHHG